MSFDLLAASLRADAGDLGAQVEALAVKLEGALPGQCQVERAGGLLARRKRVRRIVVDLGDERFQLDLDDGRIAPRRARIVRGIVLKTEELGLDGWIDALSAELAEQAQSSERARLAAQRLLEG
ncbi:MAG: hypothetical protein QOK40_1318 [Miltoncostaeaceae bacterium]|nr:hypothetical protein [Miltoncostaeaceae bacterium]